MPESPIIGSVVARSRPSPVATLKATRCQGLAPDGRVDPIARHLDLSVQFPPVFVWRAECLETFCLVGSWVEAVGYESALIFGPADAVDHPILAKHTASVDDIIAKWFDSMSKGILRRIVDHEHDRPVHFEDELAVGVERRLHVEVDSLLRQN